MKAFIILAPENSGSKMLTRYFLETGCDGEAGFIQRFDSELPAPEKNIVWKTHNLGSQPGTVEIKTAIARAAKAGYDPVVLLLFRDPFALAQGQVQRGFYTDFTDAHERAYNWYVEAFAFLKKQKIDWRVVSYDSIVCYKQDYLQMILGDFDLKHPTSFYIDD